jgi:hypothetical protein
MLSPCPKDIISFMTPLSLANSMTFSLVELNGDNLEIVEGEEYLKLDDVKANKRPVSAKKTNETIMT